MPNVTFANPYTDGDPLDADAINQVIQREEGTANSVGGVVNGFMDLDNLFDTGDTDSKIISRDVGMGQMSQHEIRAKTVNCDYFHEVFPKDALNSVARIQEGAIALAGCGIHYYVPKKARAIQFFWHVGVRSLYRLDGNSEPITAQYDHTYRLTPYFNGVFQRRLERRGQGAAVGLGGALEGNPSHGMNCAVRYWSGHWLYEDRLSDMGLWLRSEDGLPIGAGLRRPTDVGWHTFGIRVTSIAEQVRVRASRMGYMLIF